MAKFIRLLVGSFHNVAHVVELRVEGKKWETGNFFFHVAAFIFFPPVPGSMEQNATVAVVCPTATVDTVTYPTPTSWRTDITLATEGTNTLSATATDVLGNASSPVMATIMYDTTAPTTTASATGYTFGAWSSAGSVSVVLSGGDGIGSGITGGYPRSCVDTNDTCTPAASGTSVSVSCTIGTVCTQYVRYRSMDNAGNMESVQSVQVRQDLQSPGTTASVLGGLYKTAQTVTLTCNDGSGSGCSGRSTSRMRSTAWRSASYARAFVIATAAWSAIATNRR